MRKIIISILFSVLSVSIHAQDTFSLTDDQQTKIIDFICVEITKNAMSCSSIQEDRLSYHDNFEHIGKGNVKNSGFNDFERALNGPAGSSWGSTKRRFWNKINDTLRRSGADVLAEIESDTLFKNCKPDEIKREVNKYIETLKESNKPSIKTQQQPVAIKQGFSMLEMILACFISFVGGMIICIIGNLSQKVSRKKHYDHNTSHSSYDIDSTKQRNEKPKKEFDSKEITKHKDQKNRKAEVSHNQSELPKTNANLIEDSKEEKHNDEDRELNKKSDSNDNKEKNQESVTNVVDIDNLNPDEVCNFDSELEKNQKIVLKYLRKLKDDSFSKISPNIEDDSYFAFNEKTFDLTVVEDNAESALYYADDILTTNVVEIESRVSNPQRIEMLAPGKVEYVGGVWKVIKKVRIKLI